MADAAETAAKDSLKDFFQKVDDPMAEEAVIAFAVNAFYDMGVRTSQALEGLAERSRLSSLVFLDF